MTATIGLDLTSAITQGGGIGRYTRELVRALLQADTQKQYRFFSTKPPAQTPVANPVPQAPNASYHPAWLDERWLYRLWYRLKLPLPVQWMLGQVDLFHSPDFVLPPVAGNIPTLLTVHDLSFVHYPHVYPEPLVQYLNRVVPWSVQRATHILADSQATKRDLVEIWNVPDGKITVLYAGITEGFGEGAQAGVTAVLPKYHLTQPYVLTVGTVQPRKNYQMLIQAFAPVARQLPHHLVIAGGKGWLYDEMLAEVTRQGLEERVHFTGFVDDDDLPALYAGADLFVFPTVYEGFGIPLLEAMACQTAVISSNASCLPEVTGSDSGWLLSPQQPDAWTEAMLHLLTHPDERATLVQAGLHRLRRFSWQQSAQQLLAIYDGLLHA